METLYAYKTPFCIRCVNGIVRERDGVICFCVAFLENLLNILGVCYVCVLIHCHKSEEKNYNFP